MTRNQLALALGLMMPTAAAADPLVLEDRQMDTVTAAGLLTDVTSMAAARGDFTLARTNADTYVDAAQRFGIGLTTGEALACCGPDSQVEVGSAAVGASDLVNGANHAAGHDGAFLAYGFSFGIVVAASFPVTAAIRGGFEDFLEDELPARHDASAGAWRQRAAPK